MDLCKKTDLSGETLGKLTVKEEVGRNKYGERIWECGCSCGRNILLSTRDWLNRKLGRCGKCNTYREKDSHIVCTVADGREFTISKNDLLFVKRHVWHVMGTGYATTRILGKVALLHRLLLEASKGQVVDHIDGCKLNNQRKNLRTVSHQQDCFNQKLRKNNSTGYKGVSIDNTRKKLSVGIYHNGKTIHLGRFDYKDLRKAAMIYDKAAIKLFGDFARINGVI